MSVWAWPVIIYAGVLIVPALRRRMPGMALVFAALGLAAAVLSAQTNPALRFIAPLLMLLAGYWATGPF